MTLALTVSAFAAWERAGFAQIASRGELQKAATKLGMMSGNPILGGILSGQIDEAIPFADTFGTPRADGAVLIPLFFNTDKASESAEKQLDAVEWAALYPVKCSKDEFLKKTATAIETNGVIRVASKSGDFGDDVNDAQDYDESEMKYNYILFSKDGRWAAISDKPCMLEATLNCIAIAERAPAGGQLLKTEINAKLINLTLAALKEAATTGKDAAECSDLDRANIAKFASWGANMRGVEAYLAITNAGIDFGGTLTTDGQGELAEVFSQPLPAKPFAFAGADALGAFAAAENAGASTDLKALWLALTECFKKYGIEFPFITLETKPAGVQRFVLDVKQLVKCINDEAYTAKFNALEDKQDELGKALKDCGEQFKKPLTAKTPAQAVAFAIKGYAGTDLDTRLAATFPELATSVKPCVAQFGSLYSTLIATKSDLSAAAEPEVQPILEEIFMGLPPEAKAGIGGIGWRDGEKLNGLFRISADELKLLGNAANLATGMMMAQAMQELGGDDDEAGE